MNNLEVIFENVKLKDLEAILFKELNFDKGKLISSHFYDEIEKRDVELEMIPSLESFFKIPGTGNIYMNEVDIGICIQNVMTIISFDEAVGDIVLNFEESKSYQEKMAITNNCECLIRKLQSIMNTYDLGDIIIGFESASDEDMQLVTFNKQGTKISENIFPSYMNVFKDIIYSDL